MRPQDTKGRVLDCYILLGMSSARTAREVGVSRERVRQILAEFKLCPKERTQKRRGEVRTGRSIVKESRRFWKLRKRHVLAGVISRMWIDGEITTKSWLGMNTEAALEMGFCAPEVIGRFRKWYGEGMFPQRKPRSGKI